MRLSETSTADEMWIEHTRRVLGEYARGQTLKSKLARGREMGGQKIRTLRPWTSHSRVYRRPSKKLRRATTGEMGSIEKIAS
jgi:hypothetical protein